jgi:hypothetical protein
MTPYATEENYSQHLDCRNAVLLAFDVDPSGFCECKYCVVSPHKSDCAVHNEPARPAGECDCG